MLIQITPEQIASNWDFIKHAITEGGSLERQSMTNKPNRLLNALLAGIMQCWTYVESVDGGVSIKAVIITQILENEVAGIKSLLIYSLLSINDSLQQKDYAKGFHTLAQFARKMNCTQIMAFSDNPYLVQLAKTFGGNTDQRVLVLTLN